MAGAEGFEPTHTGVKVQRLTAWRYPNVYRIDWNFVLTTKRFVFELGKSYALRHAVYQMVQDRDAAKALYGSDSLEE